MATSGTIQKAIRTGYRMQIVWNVGSQSVANNSSSVTVKVQLVSTGSSYTINSSATKNGSVTINGTKYTFTFTASLSGNQTKTLYTKTVTVKHNADGTKTCSFASTIGINVTLGGTYYGDVTASGTGTFNTVARATTPTLSAPSIDMGQSITINMPRASSSFDHTLTYAFGSATGTIGSDLGTSKAWTVPLSLASQIPFGTSGTCTITCKTYNGSTLVGTKTVSFTAKVPASVVPTIGSVAVTDTMTAIYSQFGNMVQGKSKPKLTITASGAYGSTIKTYKTVFEGKSYSGATPTTAVIAGSGTVTASITITDSRGRTASVSKSWTVVAYKAPIISILTASRCDPDGTENYEGLNAKIAAAFTIASVNSKNTNSYKIEYKIKSNSTWTALKSGNAYSYSDTIITDAVFGADSAFDLRLSITDYFGTISRIIEIPTAFTLLDFNANGRALAFGKVSGIDYGVEFGMPAFFSNAETPSSVKFLQAGQDLNDVMEAGFYAIPNTAVSGSLINKPWEGTPTGSLLVMVEGNTNQRLQIMHKSSRTEGAIYERCIYQGTWGEWQTVHDGAGKVLWTGGMYMTEGHIISFSEPASKQPNGIVLVFSEYYDKAVKNQSFASFFIHKNLISKHSGSGHCFSMCTSNLAYYATKYLYIRDDGITGHANNILIATGACGISQTNNRFVLRYVLGV